MKKLLFLLTVLCILNPAAQAAEPWKGHTETGKYEFGVMTGLSLYGVETAWGFLATGAYLVQPAGWADDIDDRIWFEVQAGPALFSSIGGSSQSGFQYSTHARWDFTYNEYWTAYGLGGLAGYVLPSSFGSKFNIHPRFGAGLQYQTKTALMFRAEVSAEFMGLGVALNF